MELISTKTLAIFVLLIIALIFGVLPIWFIVGSPSWQTPERKSRLHRIIGCLNAFAGGVFMGISLMHLLPDVRILLITALGGEDNYKFNWAELCVACGFFFIVFAEQLVQMCQNKLKTELPEAEVPFSSHSQYGSCEGHPHDNLASDDTKNDLKSGDEEFNQGDSRTTKRRSSSPIFDSEKSYTSSSSRHTAVTIDEVAFEQVYLTPQRALILLISLSLHSVFEGLALGLQLDKKGLTDLFLAISLHKGIEAFTIAVGFAQISASLMMKLSSTIFFAFTSPIGIAIGIPIALSSQSDDGVTSKTGILIDGILQGLATGTFMFVTFIEILPHEFNSGKDRLLKFLLIIFGFTAITLLDVLET